MLDRFRNPASLLVAAGELVVSRRPLRVSVVLQHLEEKLDGRLQQAGGFQIQGLDAKVLRPMERAARTAQAGPKLTLIVRRPGRAAIPIVAAHSAPSLATSRFLPRA